MWLWEREGVKARRRLELQPPASWRRHRLRWAAKEELGGRRELGRMLTSGCPAVCGAGRWGEGQAGGVTAETVSKTEKQAWSPREASSSQARVMSPVIPWEERGPGEEPWRGRRAERGLQEGRDGLHWLGHLGAVGADTPPPTHVVPQRKGAGPGQGLQAMLAQGEQGKLVVGGGDQGGLFI